MPPNPPPAANGPPLRKFTLHAPALTASSSPLTLGATGTGPIPIATLTSLRATLVGARNLASDRLAIRDANRRNIAERQANEKRVAEETARVKEAERKRKREEDERREKERVEKAERDRIEREKEDAAQRKREEEQFERAKKEEEERKRAKDEQERLAAVQRAREIEEKKRAEQVLELVRASEETRLREEQRAQAQAQAAQAAAALASQEDVKMEDAPPSEPAPAATPASPQAPAPPLPLSQIPVPPPSLNGATQSTTASQEIVPAITVESSPDLEDDTGPKLIRRADKKKRKRDQVVDSDASGSDSDEDVPLLQKSRKLEAQASQNATPSATPLAQGTPKLATTALAEVLAQPTKDPYEGLSTIERKLKEEKFVKHSIPIRPPAPGNATAFYLPTNPRVPPRPQSVAPASTAKRQSDVRGDFSAAKPGTQIAHHTFHTWADAYLRPFGEDDLAFLAPKPDDITPYIIPPLGRHYTEVWEEEEAGLPPGTHSAYASPLEPPPLPRIRPDALNEDALGAENVFLGPLSERLVAALAFVEPGADDDEDGGAGGGDGKGDGGEDGEDGEEERVQLDAVELEERIKRELRFIGILPDDDVDWSSREDDEVSSTLRACQRELHRQTTLNEARKAMLTSVVKDRMAFQEYETIRDAQERVIENGWTKRQRAGKKKGKGKERERTTRADEGKLAVSLALLQAIEKRHKLVSQFRPFFEDEEDKGRFSGIPEQSRFDGLEVDQDEAWLEPEVVTKTVVD